MLCERACGVRREAGVYCVCELGMESWHVLCESACGVRRKAGVYYVCEHTACDRREAGVYYVCELGREAGMCCVRAHTACDVDTTSATKQLLAVSRRAAQTGLLTGTPESTPFPTRYIHERQEQTPCMSGTDKLHCIVLQTVKSRKRGIQLHEIRASSSVWRRGG